MVELIRNGKAPEVIRRKGAAGSLPLPAAERVEILTLLAAAPEADLREKALETLRGFDIVELRRVLASPLTAHDVLQFAAEHLVDGREELREILIWNPSLPPEACKKLQAPPPSRPVEAEGAKEAPGQPQTEPLREPPARETAPGSASAPPPGPPLEAADEEIYVEEAFAKIVAGEEGEIETPPEVAKTDDELTQKDRETLIEKINRMSVVEKIKAALTGNMETRSLLIRDSNKIISRAVLQSPKISEMEAEGYAAAKNVSEEVLRLLAANRKFMKAYVVMRALANNPRAPVDVTVRLINRLTDRDLKGLGQNRNVPEVIRSMALKRIKQKEEASKPKLPGRH